MTLGIDSDDFGSSASKLSDLIRMTLGIDSDDFGSNLVGSKSLPVESPVQSSDESPVESSVESFSLVIFRAEIQVPPNRPKSE